MRAISYEVARHLLSDEQLAPLQGSGKVAMWYENRINKWPESTALDRRIKLEAMKNYWQYMSAFGQGGVESQPVLYYPQLPQSKEEWEDGAIANQRRVVESNKVAADRELESGESDCDTG